MPGFHHVELWVDDISAARDSWGWLLERLGFPLEQEWPAGSSWQAGGAYLTMTESPSLADPVHDRRRAGLNHLAFRGGTRTEVDALVADAAAHGWTHLYADRYPHAGGPDHYAGWLENAEGFKVEIVAAA
ncbi:VOC family protein [Microbacterium karelineae]|uniref:VOC family protein n=1 Tax=Microbacterium karelineae TaxID=2654283 RepID=UPI0012EAB79C|nr:VOC family protein [Microbacterium karelineae]